MFFYGALLGGESFFNKKKKKNSQPQPKQKFPTKNFF